MDVHVAESPAKFSNKNDCHAYYIPNTERKAFSGLFGFIHLSKMDETPAGVELMAHEIDHLMADWRKSRHIVPSDRNEERLATLRGQIERSFWNGWRRWSNG